MRIFKRLRWLIATLSAMGLVAIFTMTFRSHWVRIQEVRIEMAETSKEDVLFERVRAALGTQMKAVEGKYFWEVPLSEIFKITSKDKRVKNVSIYREFPSRLRLVIEPHTPVLAYLGGDGRVYPVAMDATLLPPVAVKDAPDLPFLRGDGLRDEEMVRESAIELFEAIPTEGALRRSRISEIVYSKKEGFKVFVSGSRAELKFGDTDFGPKVSRVQKVLAYLDSRDIKGRVIDARFAKKVVVRVRNTP